jgi:hypothetical protein
MIHFPYGIANFARIMESRQYYIDRTDRTRTMEETGRQLLLLRPRRFAVAVVVDSGELLRSGQSRSF